MSKDFKAHGPAPARTKAGGRAALAAPRRIGPVELEAAAKAKAKHGDTPGGNSPSEKPREIGGPEGPEPTRYGDWERKGICVDF